MFGSLGNYIAQNLNITLDRAEYGSDGEKYRNQLARPQPTPQDADESREAAETGPFIDMHMQESPVEFGGILERLDQGSSLPLNIESNAWRYTCDGCQLDAEAAGSMFFCEVCYDVNFCATCLDKAKTSSLEERYCNPHHSWFQAWPIQEDVEETICRSPGGSPGLTREWLDALRSEWLIE